ncbi:MAG: hypothetical protein AAGD22_09440 [Verrucomicrobiota bacterium]
MTAQTIELPNHKLGDRWPAGADETTVLKIGPILINGEAPPNSLFRVEMRFKQDASRYIIDSDPTQRDAPLNITNAATWEAEIPVTQNFLPSAGRWEWDLAFYDTVNASPLTLFAGTQTVLSQI